LRNILLAFSRRNICIGYVQGFNFIVGRLLKIITDEEKCFWVFCQIIETILPLNYYSEFAGMMVDVDILICLLQKYFPDLMEILELYDFIEYFKNIIFQWFVSLFTHNFSYNCSLIIWDVLFLDKSVSLFKVTIGLVKMIKNDLMKIDSLEAFQQYMKDVFNKFNDESFLKYYLILRRFEFNIDIINKNRCLLQGYMIEHINKINKIKNQKLKERIAKIEDSCNDDWPICIYDSESPYTIYDHFVYRAQGDPVFIDDYFEAHNYFKNSDQTLPTVIEKKKKKKLTFQTILVERKGHKCVKRSKYTNNRILSRFSMVLDKVNELDESVNLSTDDKSSDRSGSDEKTISENDSKLNSSELYQHTKSTYKKIRKIVLTFRF
jgi:hypothetical protein